MKNYTFVVRGTFSLELTKDTEFWDKVLYVEKWRSSGLGGPGDLWLVTSEKLLYQINFETFPYDENHLEEFNDFFAEEYYDRENDKHTYKIESKGWKYLDRRRYGEDIWIREEYAEIFEQQYIAKRKEKGVLVFGPQLFAGQIGVEGEIERMLEENFAKMNESR